MKRTDAARPSRLARLALGAAACLAFGVAGLALLLAPLPGTTAEAAALGRGIVEYRLEEPAVASSAIPGMIAEMGPGSLGARWTRIVIHWNALQPFAPGTSYSGDTDGDGYADAYVAQLEDIVNRLNAAGIRIVMTPLDVPEWASNRTLWNKPPPGYKKGVYYSFYAPDMSSTLTVASVQFKALGAFLAARFKGRVGHFECWNEPNQGLYLYPQTPAGAKRGGGATYLKMLKQWYAGVNAGNRSAVVIAGATAPRGRGDAVSTPPQAFARYLKAKGAGAYMDAYSHHPYTPGGSRRVAPDQLPNNAGRAVTLGNLSVLTKLFPTKPFYLTEFGYNTQASKHFGVAVSTADQARYLRQAYSYTASRYKKVKALMWFMVDDMAAAPGAARNTGVYMGVRWADGVRKPSWYAFAGGNKLTLRMPSSAKAGALFTVSGVLTYKRPADAASQTLTLQARSPSRTAWKNVASVKTDPATGAYSRTIKQSRTRVYRIIWGGVCESATRKVTTR